MSERALREAPTRRSSFRKSLTEAALPPEYLEALEQKRKQLDESIHKYIAAKEREYKQFEKEAKSQYKLAQNGEDSNGSGKRRGSPETRQVDGQRTSAADALLLTSAKRDGTTSIEDYALQISDKSTIANLTDRRASVERERDFIGLFTPQYLPALDAKHGQQAELSSSAPNTINQPTQEEVENALERANSDPIVPVKPKRPSHLALTQRTSSSGSSIDGKLASAMKSPTQRPKQKRVSLAVGDSIVAPSDNVPLSLISQNNTPSHSRRRSQVPERELPISIKRATTVEQEVESAVAASLQEAEPRQRTSLLSEEIAVEEIIDPPAFPPPTSSPKSKPSPKKADPDGDFFDLEEEEDDDDVAVVISDDEESIDGTDDEITGRIVREEQIITPPSPRDARYDPTTGMIPEPPGGEKDSAVPYLTSGPGSAAASQQPIQPGFRRPSVVYDPVYRGANYQAAEKNAVENDVYGSSYIRPGSKGSFTAGSLGESYMAANAEKIRAARKEAQVKS